MSSVLVFTVTFVPPSPPVTFPPTVAQPRGALRSYGDSWSVHPALAVMLPVAIIIATARNLEITFFFIVIDLFCAANILKYSQRIPVESDKLHFLQPLT